jgi:hypothetical protein
VIWECVVRKNIEGSVRRVLEVVNTEAALTDHDPSDTTDQALVEINGDTLGY